MIYAERGNKVRQISEDEIQKYADLGYMIKDSNGTVLRETVPTDIGELKLAYIQHIDEIKRLKAEIVSLKSQISNISQKKSENTVEGNTVEGNAVEEPVKKGRRKSEKSE